MPDGSGQSPTRTMYLELQEERKLVEDGFELLDEKRILLAAEILRQLSEYRSIHETFQRQFRRSVKALGAAYGRHGIDGLQVYPAAAHDRFELKAGIRNVIGLAMVHARLELNGTESPLQPCNPSAEARACADAFGEVLKAAAVLAAVSGNLHRLKTEYERTERKVRALENVVLPDIRDELKRVADYLDLTEQEDVIRVRQFAGMKPGRGLG